MVGVVDVVYVWVGVNCPDVRRLGRVDEKKER
jgi:hypothetical protein